MIDKWNKFLDDTQLYIQNFCKQNELNNIWVKYNNDPTVKRTLSYLESNPMTQEFYNLVKNSNDYKNCKFRMLGSQYQLSYIDRRRLTIYPCFFLAMIALMKKSGGLGKIFSIYIFMSALLCRENFDLKNYKLK